MSEHKVYAVPAVVAKHALVNHEDYARMYEASIAQPEKFWPAQANQFLSWSKPWHTLSESDLPRGKTAWFIGGQLNACYNCVDRHLPERAQQTAIIWEGDEPDQEKHITYQELFEQVSRFANALKDRGVLDEARALRAVATAARYRTSEQSVVFVVLLPPHRRCSHRPRGSSSSSTSSLGG